MSIVDELDDECAKMRRELNAANERNKMLEAEVTELRETLQRERVVNRLFKNANERHLREAQERVAALEQIIQRARVRFCGNGEDGTTCADMLRILDEATKP